MNKITFIQLLQLADAVVNDKTPLDSCYAQGVVDALKDAARYRWLSAELDERISIEVREGILANWWDLSCEETDKQIDFAMRRETAAPPAAPSDELQRLAHGALTEALRIISMGSIALEMPGDVREVEKEIRGAIAAIDAAVRGKP